MLDTAPVGADATVPTTFVTDKLPWTVIDCTVSDAFGTELLVTDDTSTP